MHGPPGVQGIPGHVRLYEPRRGVGIDLTPYQFRLEADGAFYDPYYCSYAADPCDGSIGVPANGSASCSLFFQVPASITEAELRAVNTR